MTRYTYLGGKARMMNDPLRGLQCDPVKNAGKCVIAGLRKRQQPGVIECGNVRIEIVNRCSQRSMGTALVEDETGRRHVVMRRRLRLNREVKST